MIITKNDAINLIDALNEWYEIVQPKELEKNEIGLNDKRFQNIILKLKLIGERKNEI